MKTKWLAELTQLLYKSLLAVALIGAVTLPLFLIGRATLGEAVIAMVYIIPIVWVTSRWGQLPGICAAIAAAMCFDFLFIPPFFTFAIGALEGWLVLTIFLGVSLVVVNRIQSVVREAREKVFLFELSSALSIARNSSAVANIVAKYIFQLLPLNQVRVILNLDHSEKEISVKESRYEENPARPDRVVPILNDDGLVGEIQVWRDPVWDGVSGREALLEMFAAQAGKVLGRTHHTELELAALSGKRP